ncbi:diacylglycerol O-acyltransferase [Rhodococcus rhodochrous]|nr:diacylglycerol O-acyltransferase [Rhodococcus rhodochrous]
MSNASDRHMQQTDYLTWSMEKDPALRSTIVAVVLLDASPDWDRLCEMMDRGTREVPSFRHRVVEVPFGLAPPRWVADANFDLSWHMRRVSLPGPANFDDVLEFARTTAMAAFDKDRPLWEMTVVDGLAGGQAALLIKVHHALTDGIGGMQITARLVDFDRDGTPREPAPEPPAPESPDSLDLAAEAIGWDWSQLRGLAGRGLASIWPTTRAVVTNPIGSARNAAGVAASVARYLRPILRLESPVMTERTLSRRLHVIDVPLDRLRDAAHRGGATLNSAFLTAVLVGLAEYHHRHGSDVDELRVTMPLSIRTDQDTLGGNRINLARFPLPVRSDDPLTLMQEVNRIVEGWRHEPAVPMAQTLATPLNLLPPAVVGEMLKHVDFLASNVPGSPVALYVAGAKVERYYAFGPTLGSAFNVTLMSYLHTCCVGFTLDTGAVPDLEVFDDCMRDGFHAVLEA